MRAFVSSILIGLFCVSGCTSSSGGTKDAASVSGESTPWGPAYPNMPSIVPPNVRPNAFAAVPTSALGPSIDPSKGYRTEDFGGGVFMLTDGAEQVMLVVSDVGVILVDAPPGLGANILKAVSDVAPGAKIMAMIYSHDHIDHIGYAGEILKTNPAMAVVAHEETRKLLMRAQDPNRPVPTTTFNTQDEDFPLTIGKQTLLLQYPGPNHEPGNIGIYHPGQKVLMLVDIIFPGWMMWRRLAVAKDIPGYFNVVKTMGTRWNYQTLISGHVGRAGTRADVDTQLEFMTDLHNATYEAITTVHPGETLSPLNANNPWAGARDYLDRVTIQCVNKLSPKWSTRLAAFDVWIYEQCQAMEQSLRVDGPSLK